MKRRFEMLDMTDIEELSITTRRTNFEKWIIEIRPERLQPTILIKQVLSKET